MQLRAIQGFLNSALATDPDARDELRRFSGRCVEVVPEGSGGILRLYPGGAGLELEWLADPSSPGHVGMGALAPEADVVIRGVPSTLLLSLKSLHDQRGSITVGLEVRGDLGLLDDLRRVVAGLSIDWEELLAQRIGDVAAHQLWRGLTRLTAWGQDAGESLGRSAAEWLRYESGIAVSCEETRRFCTEVDDARDHLARLEARVARLERDTAQPRREGDNG